LSEQLSIHTFGGLRLQLGERPVVGLASRKAEALLVYLACTGRPHERELLGTLLWDDRSSERARGNLTVLLASLRKELAPFLVADRHTIGFNRAAPHWLDVAELEAAVAGAGQPETLPPGMAEQLEAALTLYRGDFLQGFTLRDCAGFEEWVLAEQQRLARLTVGARRGLLATYRARGDHAAALAQAEELLRLDTLDEDTHRQMMELLALSGRRGAALEHYERLRSTLERELDARPAAATAALYQRIRSGDLGAPAAGPPTGTSTRPRAGRPINLPFRPAPILGREAELAQIEARLADPACRLLTLVGPGGIGKTSLAVEAATARASAHGGSVVFVPLAPLAAADQIVAAIAAALGLHLSEHIDPQSQLLAYLAERNTLLVLDNFEHLLDGAELVNTLLAQVARVRLLVTSRERLRLRAEWLYEVQGLAYPPAGLDEASEADLASFSAVQLFAQRAGQLAPGFALDAPTLDATARICRMVEGMPLAIELAAGRVLNASCAEIAAQIAHNLGLLESELRDLPARHRSVRAVFTYSWDLLSTEERAVLARLAVFQGGCSEEAAHQIAGASPELLTILIEKSMLRRSDGQRYDLHELLRQFALERLAAVGAQPVRERHSRYYLGLVARVAPSLSGREPQVAARELQPELGNLREAWRYAVAQGLYAELAGGVAGLGRWHVLSGTLAEGAQACADAAAPLWEALEVGATTAQRELLQRLLLEQADLLNRRGLFGEALICARQAASVDTALPPLATSYGEALWGLGRYDEARAELAHTAEQARATGARAVEAASLRLLGLVMVTQSDYPQARAFYEQALAHYRALGDVRGEGNVLNNLGVAAEEQGDYPQARAFYEQALAIQRTIGNRNGEEYVLCNLGVVASGQSYYSEAIALFEQALRICQETGDRQSEGIALLNLGDVARALGDYPRARDYFEQSLALRHILGDRLGESYTLVSLGLLSLNLGDYESALQQSEAARRIADDMGARSLEAAALTNLGGALAGLGRYNDAYAAYTHALNLREALSERHRALESRAGLALALLAAGDPRAAYAQAVQIFPALEHGPPPGLAEPLSLYWACSQAFQAVGDSRAAGLIARAREAMAEMATHIDQPALRRVFLRKQQHANQG